MAYKEKECPKCGDKHSKRGEYCSRSCGNQRKHTSEQKRKIGEKRSQWLTSGADEAEVQKHNFIGKSNSAPPEPIAPMIQTPVANNQFVQDGDLWTEID